MPQNTTLWGQFSSITFVLVLWLELKLPGLHDKDFYSLHHSAGYKQMLIVVKFIFIVPGQDVSSRFMHEGLLIHVPQVNLSLTPARSS